MQLEERKKKESLVTCPHCSDTVAERNLGRHIKKRCKKSPAALGQHNKTQLDTVKPKADRKTPTVINVRARLEKLFRELESGALPPDEVGLAREFKAFYHMYVWQGDGHRINAARAIGMAADGTPSTSIRAVSGGLPSLGKNSR